MPPLLRRLVPLLGLVLAAAAPSGPLPPLRVSGELAGEPVELEIRDLARIDAEAALDAAWAALATAEREVEAWTEQSARQPLILAPEPYRLFRRMADFCSWSDGAVSALGGAVSRLWEGDAVAALPVLAAIDGAVATTTCDRMRLDDAARRVEVAVGTVLDLRRFVRGWAVDRAVEAARARGATNLRIRFGPIRRAVGGGADGRGWEERLPAIAGSTTGLGTIRLLDRALVVADATERPIRIAGERFSRYLDLRTGRPSTGVVAAVVATELAIDAEPLAAAMVVLGAHGGQLRLGSLRPRPAVLWLLGSIEGGEPVVTTYHWSSLRQR